MDLSKPVFSHSSKGTQGSTTASRLSGSLTYSGSLDSYEHFDVTNVIGREFPNLELSEILHDETKVRDLAILGEYQQPLDTSISDTERPEQSPSASPSD